jgi:peptidyl-prolyl cis-trans isomerase D
MLEAMRRNSRSLIIYIIFGILIAVFIVSFGPQSGQGGCSSSTKRAVKVNGHTIEESTWRYALLTYGQGAANGERARRSQIREKVMDGLISRELLAQAAEKAGFRVSDDEVGERLAKGEVILLNRRYNSGPHFEGDPKKGETPRFTRSALERFARGVLGLPSVTAFIDEQKREMLAQKMRDLLTLSVRVSPEEVKTSYLEANHKADIEYVVFDPGTYADTIELTPAELETYAKAHEEDLKKKYEGAKARYTGRAKEVRLRVITLKKTAVEPGATPGTAPASAPTSAAMPDPKRAKAEAALNKIKAGADFAAIARETSEDPSAKKGGLLDWRPAAALRLGDAVSTTVEKLEKGKMSDVIETPTGFAIVRLEDRREGDQSYEQVKHELAEEGLREEKANAAAKADAEAVLAKAKSGTTLEQQFPPAPETSKEKSRLQKQTGITRASGFVPGIGAAPELVKELFDVLTPGTVGDKVYQVGGDQFVVRLVARTDPDMAKFEKDKAKIGEYLALTKASAVLSEWEAQSCKDAKDQRSLELNESYVAYTEADGATKSPPYVPCSTLENPFGNLMLE